MCIKKQKIKPPLDRGPIITTQEVGGLYFLKPTGLGPSLFEKQSLYYCTNIQNRKHGRIRIQMIIFQYSSTVSLHLGKIVSYFGTAILG